MLWRAFLDIRRVMSSTFSARGALRAATAAHHERVDAVFSRADLTKRDHYARFLQAQAGAYLPVAEPKPS